MRAITQFKEEYPPENRINVSWINIGPSTPYVGGDPVSLKKRSPTIKSKRKDEDNCYTKCYQKIFHLPNPLFQIDPLGNYCVKVDNTQPHENIIMRPERYR